MAILRWLLLAPILSGLCLASCVSPPQGLNDYSKGGFVRQWTMKPSDKKPFVIETTLKPTPETPQLKFKVRDPNITYIIREYEKLEKTSQVKSYKPLANSGWITGAIGLLYFLSNPAPDPTAYGENEYASVSDKKLQGRLLGFTLMMGGGAAGVTGTVTQPQTIIGERPAGIWEDKIPQEPKVGKTNFTVTVNDDPKSVMPDATNDKAEGVIQADAALSRNILGLEKFPDNVALDIKLTTGEKYTTQWTLEETIALITHGKVDWSKGISRLMPYPQARAEISGPAYTEPSENRASEEDKPAILKLSISNKWGKGDCYRLMANIKSDEPAFNRRVLIGKLKSGEETVVQESFAISRTSLNRLIPITIGFDELNNNPPDTVEARLWMKGTGGPAFAYSCQVIDDGTGKSAGNGDGRIQKGETVDLLVTVKNIGNEEAAKVSATASTNLTAGIELQTKSVDLGDIAPDSTKPARFTIKAYGDDVLIQELGLSINVSDSAGKSKLGWQEKWPIDSSLASSPPRRSGADFQVTAVSKDIVIAGQTAAIKTGCGSDMPTLAQSPEGAVLKAVGQAGAWYKVKISDAEFGWVEVAAVKEIESPPAGTVEPLRVFHKAPPDIAILQPSIEQTTEEMVGLNGLIADDGEVKDIQVLVNNNPIEVKMTARTGAARFSCLISLETGDNEIKINATDNEGLVATRALIVTRLKQEVYVLIIGIGKYQDINIKELTRAEADAEGIYKFYTGNPDTPAKPENVTLLLGKDATGQRVEDTINQLAEKAKEHDIVICYYAGHCDVGVSGLPVGQTGEEQDKSAGTPTGKAGCYLILYDAVKDNLPGTAIGLEDFRVLWERINSKYKVFMVDCCHSAELAELKDEVPEGLEEGLDEGSVVILASAKGQPVVEIAESQYDLFTGFLLDGLQGQADTDLNGKVSASEIAKYVEKRVPEKAAEMEKEQTPVIKIKTPNEIYLTK